MKRILFCAILTIVGTGMVRAAGFPACGLPGFNGMTLGALVANDASCVVGDKLFTDFSSTSDAVVTDELIFHPLAPVANDPGIEFTGATAGAGQTVTINFAYTVYVLSGSAYRIEQPDLHFGGVAFGNGNGSIAGTQQYCADGAGDVDTCGDDGGTLYSVAGGVNVGAPATLFDGSVNVPNLSSLDVETNLTITGGTGTSTTVGAIDERFAETPEPASLFLLASGLVLTAGCAIRRKRA